VDPQLLTALIAFVAPLAALAGVFVGQRMQRQTTREQLAEQRRRDELTWNRENRHRFTSEKRVLYADFLAAAMKFSNFGASAHARLLAQNITALAERPDSVEQAHSEIVEQHNYKTKLLEASLEFNDVLTRLLLIASSQVRDSAERYADYLIGLAHYAVYDMDFDAAKSSRYAAIKAKSQLEEAMRADLLDEERNAEVEQRK
jgi:hypothetical protein